MLAPISFRIPKELRDRFDRVVEAGAVNKSKLIRQWIEEYTSEEERRLNVMAKVTEIIEEKHDYPIVDESYTVGRVDDGRYFFAWGPDYPRDGGDGYDVVPAYEILDGESGISFHDTADAALSEMEAAVDAVEDTRP